MRGFGILSIQNVSLPRYGLNLLRDQYSIAHRLLPHASAQIKHHPTRQCHSDSSSFLDSSFVNQQIRELIRKSDSTQQILTIVNDHRDKIQFETETIRIAIESTNAMQHYSESTRLMDFFLTESRFQPTINEFQVLLDGLSTSGDYELCSKYLNLMINEYGITPNLSIFSAVIRSCKQRAVFDEAQRFWDLMVNEYGIEPDERAYHELMSVHLRSGKKHSVTALFNEYLSRLKRNELSLSPPLFVLHLRNHCQFGDIQGMQSAVDLMTSFGIDIANTPTISLYLVKGYFAAKRYEECLSTLDEMVRSGLTVKLSHLTLRGAVLLNMMRDRVRDIEAKRDLHQEINRIFYVELKERGLRMSPFAWRLLLSAAIVCFHNFNPMKMVQVFEGLVGDQRIRFRKRCALTGKMAVDLHGFDKTTAQFVLRYLMAFELSDSRKYAEWMDHHGVLDGYLVILCGKGLHSMGRPNHRGHLREFVMEELLRFDPPIRSEIDPDNTGQIKVHRSELIEYMKCDGEINYAMHRLAVPSEDWYITDTEERKQGRKQNVEQFCYRWNQKKRFQRRNRGMVSRHTMNEKTAVLAEGQSIEVYDENIDQWNRFTLKKKLSHSQFIVYDPGRQRHRLLDLKHALQLQ